MGKPWREKKSDNENHGLILLCAALLGMSTSALAQNQFANAEDAVAALVGAARSGDAKAILAVLGPDGQAIVSSGDPVADSNTREKFVSAYDAKHELELEGNGMQTLVIGTDNWPFPIPLINKGGQWQFDTKAGLDEILSRRIGRNEFSAIQVSLLTSRHKTSMPHSILRALGVVSMRKNSLVIRERRTGSIGRRPRERRRARSAISPRKLRLRVTRPARSPFLTMDITIGSSCGRAPTLRAAPTTIW